MSKPRVDFLKREGLLNPKPERVSHPLFEDRALEFFDPYDLPQVRYEMLRAAKVENRAVAKACRQFGFSRERFYQFDKVFMERGYVALVGSSSAGRRPLIALNQEIVSFIVHRKLEDPKVSGDILREEIHKRYMVDCSRRTVERVLENVGLGAGKGGLSRKR